MKDKRDFTDRVRKVLEQDLQQLDDTTVSRLAQARRTALEGRKRNWQTPAAWAMAAGVVLAVTLSLVTGRAPLDTRDPGDFEMLIAGETLELYEELDFYDWLASDAVQTDTDA